MGLDDRKRSGFTPSPIKPASMGKGGVTVVPNFLQKQVQAQQATQNVQDVLDQTKKQPFGIPPGSELRIGQEPSVQIPLNRKLTKEEINLMGMADAFDISTKQVENFMNSDPEKFRESYELATAKLGGNDRGPRGNVFGIPTAIGNEDAQYLNFLLEDMSDRVLRLRSGAQINENEFQRLRSLLPTYIDITSDEDGSFLQIRRKLQRFKQEFNASRDRIIQGTKYEDSGFMSDESGNVLNDFGGGLKPGTQLTYDPDIWGDFGAPIPGLNRSRRNI